MRRHLNLFCLLVISGGSALSFSLSLHAESTRRTLEFRDPRTDELLIVGDEETRIEGGNTIRITDYHKPEAPTPVICHEETEYGSENLVLIRYVFEDFASGEKASFRIDGGAKKVEYRDNPQAKIDLGTIDLTSQALGNAAVPTFVQRNAERIKKGETVPFELFVPFKQTTFAFQATLKSSNPTVIKIEPSNWLLRQFVKKAAFVLDDKAPTPQVKRFIGPSHVQIKGEDTREVVVSEKEK